MNKDERDIYNELDTKPSTQTFTWTVGILVVIVMAIFAWQASRISAMEDKVSDAQLSNVRIETQLAQIQTDLAEIKTTLKGR